MIEIINKCKHFLQKIYCKIKKEIKQLFTEEEHILYRTRYLRDDGTTGYGFTPTGTDHEAERHWRALWADRLGPDGEFHNAGTDRWPDKKKD